MSRPLALLLTLSALGLAACGDDATIEAPPTAGASASTPAATTPPAAASTPAAAPAGDCVKKAEPGGGGKALPCPTETIDPSAKNVITFKTSEGSFDVTLDGQDAPATANSVAYLAKRGFYDGLDFHRVVPDFVIQGGDPNGDGTGGPGYSVTEAPPAGLTYTRGVVAMAKGGADAPGASGSQFFVVSAADVGLPAEYALVGKISKGLGTVDRITALGEGDGPPRKKVIIETATLKAG